MSCRYDSYCGLYCGACPVLGANERNDQDWIKKTVIIFIEETSNYFSRESLDNAVKYFNPDEKKRMRQLIH